LLRFFGEGDAGFGQRAQPGCHAVVRIAARAEPAANRVALRAPSVSASVSTAWLVASPRHVTGEWPVIDCGSRIGLARKRRRAGDRPSLSPDIN
jgi:hypothetical protein